MELWQRKFSHLNANTKIKYSNLHKNCIYREIPRYFNRFIVIRKGLSP